MTMVRATVAKVEVYRRGCTLTLRAVAPLEQGENHLAIEGLPAMLDDASVMLKVGKGVAQGRVWVTRSTERPGAGPSDERAQLNSRATEVDLEIANKETELRAWKDMAARMVGPAALDYLDRLPETLARLSGELESLRAERREISERLNAQGWWCASPMLEADLVAGSAGKTPLVITCRSTYASWQPTFDVMVDEVGKPLSIRLRAEVTQMTGCDWDQVELRLSTGTTELSGDLPRFFPRYLSKARPAPAGPPHTFGGRGLPASPIRASMPSAFSMASASMDESPTGAFEWDTDSLGELVTPEAEAISQATTMTYAIPGTQSLASGGDPLRLVVKTSEYQASYYYYVYARKESTAHLVARLDSVPMPEMLSQKVAVYLEGSYAGTIRALPVDDAEGYELPLGRDARVLVRRSEDVYRSKRMLGAKESVEHHCRIEVQNRKDAPITIEMLEQVPVSRDKEIEVTLRDGSGASLDAATGMLRWRKTMEAGAKATFAATYLVTHPSGLELEERERRQAAIKKQAQDDFWGPDDTIF